MFNLVKRVKHAYFAFHYSVFKDQLFLNPILHYQHNCEPFVNKKISLSPSAIAEVCISNRDDLICQEVNLIKNNVS